MGNNSIKSKLDKNTTISTIKLTLSADIDKKLCLIVVEGDDDQKFFKKFIADNVYIYESYSGKEGVREIVNCPYINSDRVIGIRDKDYCKESPTSKMFYYDFSCLEMMIIKDEEVCNALISEFYDGDKSRDSLTICILKELLPISLLRKRNEEESEGIRFHGLSINNIIAEDSSVSKSKLIDNLKKLNNEREFDIIFDEIYQQTFDEINLDDLLYVTNGHDFIHYFSVLCNRYRSTHICEKHISPCLRSAYDIRKFKKTNLYSEILKCNINIFN